MFVKLVVLVCLQALLVQLAVTQCSRPAAGEFSGVAHSHPPVWGARGCGAHTPGVAASLNNALGYGNAAAHSYSSQYPLEVIPTSGGAFSITSSSALAPNGLTVTSENVYEGLLSAAGELPFVSAVALEGVLPSGGAGAVSYSCGQGVAIESIAPAAGVAYAPAGAGHAPATGFTASGISAGPAVYFAASPAFNGLAAHASPCGLAAEIIAHPDGNDCGHGVYN